MAVVGEVAVVGAVDGDEPLRERLADQAAAEERLDRRREEGEDLEGRPAHGASSGSSAAGKRPIGGVTRIRTSSSSSMNCGRTGKSHSWR